MKNTANIYKKQWLLWAYVIIAIFNILGNLLPMPLMVYISKPLLMSTLLLFFWLNRNEKYQIPFQRYISVGLFFSLLGDSFLMFEGKQFFLLGLGCFFITHIAYIIAFLKYQTQQAVKSNYLTYLFTIIFTAYFFGMSYFLWDKLPSDFRIPVILYSVIISVMAVVGAFFARQLNKNNYILLMAGISLFVISDSCIAINSFTDIELFSPRFSIMSTYILAQLFIVIVSVNLLRKSA